MESPVSMLSLAIKPLSCQLRNNMQSLSVFGLQETVILSIFADDIVVFITKQEDIQALTVLLCIKGHPLLERTGVSVKVLL